MAQSKNPSPPITMGRIRGWVLLAAAAAVVAALVMLIRPDPEPAPAGPGGWLTGGSDERLDRLAAQHGGMGVAMWEIGYRFRELAWAGEIEDWNYARYQLEHLEEALWLGVDRRPQYTASATAFVQESVAPLRDLIATEPVSGFTDGFRMLTAGCIRCHQQEDAPLIDLNTWASARRIPPPPTADR